MIRRLPHWNHGHSWSCRWSPSAVVGGLPETMGRLVGRTPVRKGRLPAAGLTAGTGIILVGTGLFWLDPSPHPQPWIWAGSVSIGLLFIALAWAPIRWTALILSMIAAMAAVAVPPGRAQGVLAANVAKAGGSPSTAGAGVSLAPVCERTPIQPGGSATIGPGFFFTNIGNGDEHVSVTVQQLSTHSWFHGIAYPVPPSWVSVSYPPELWVVPQHSVDVHPGGHARLPVTITVPAGARRGAYAALLDAGAGQPDAGQPGVTGNLGAAGMSWLFFLVGVSQPPHWPLQLLGMGCWTKPGQWEPWQEWAGTPYATAPPGWYWSKLNESWAYDPPPGWVMNWSVNPARLEYRGGRPVHPCLSAAAVARYNNNPYEPFLGHGYPYTGTGAGCKRWLAASAAGTLADTPNLPAATRTPSEATGAKAVTTAQHAVSKLTARASSSRPGSAVLAVLAVLAGVVILLALIAVPRMLRRGRRRR